MLEKVARAIYESYYGSVSDDVWRVQKTGSWKWNAAHAALNALLEPTKEMLRAAHVEGDDTPGPESMGRADIEQEWRAMIRAARDGK